MATISSICVYCGSRYGDLPVYRNVARELGQRMAALNIRLVYGGGHVGLMGTIADAVLDSGGEAVGIIPEHLFQEEVAHSGLTNLRVVDTMHTRKHLMFELSDAFVILPGGIGTLDETFEIISWRQLGLHDRPVVVLNTDEYWQPFMTLFDHIIASEFAAPTSRQLFAVADTVDALFHELARAPEPRIRAKPDLL